MSKVLIEDWWFATYNPKLPISRGNNCVCGTVTGDPRRKDGTVVVTGNVVESKGLEFWTANTHYLLGKPKPEYLAWMLERGFKYQPENPLWCFNATHPEVYN